MIVFLLKVGADPLLVLRSNTKPLCKGEASNFNLNVNIPGDGSVSVGVIVQALSLDDIRPENRSPFKK